MVKTFLTTRSLAVMLTGSALLMAPSWGQPIDAAVPKAGSVAAQDVANIETYLTDLRSLKAHFVQLEPSGNMSTGNLYYAKPDKMRLDYDDPNPVLIVANGWQLLYLDRKLDQATHILTSQTPFAFLLEKKVELDGDVMITEHRDTGSEIHLTVVKTEEPDLGAVQLVFGKTPLSLRRWIVTDAQGLTTQIILEQAESDVAIDDKLFLLCDPNAVIKKDGC